MSCSSFSLFIVANSDSNIIHVGESGSGINRRPEEFILNCPKCGKPSNRAFTCLYHLKPRPVKCPYCSCTTTAAKWQCPCNIPWMACTSHREEGLQCKSRRKSSNSANLIKASPSSHSSQARMRQREHAEQKRLARLGPLGNAIVAPLLANSGAACTNASIKRARIRPHKIIDKEKAPCMPIAEPSRGQASILYPDDIHIVSSRPGTNDYCISKHHDSKAGPNVCKNTSSQQHPTTTPSKRTSQPLPSAPKPKRARVPFKPAPSCRGLCPMFGWTIDLFCESCHG